MAVWLSGLSPAAVAQAVPSGWLTDPRALPGAWGVLEADAPWPGLEHDASSWVTVWTDSVEAPEDLSRRRSSEEACSSRMGDRSGSVNTSSDREPSMLRWTVLPPVFPGSPGRGSA